MNGRNRRLNVGKVTELECKYKYIEEEGAIFVHCDCGPNALLGW